MKRLRLLKSSFIALSLALTATVLTGPLPKAMAEERPLVIAITGASSVERDFFTSTAFRVEQALMRVAREAMLAAMDAAANPSSVHAEGRAARRVIEAARRDVAALVNGKPEHVVNQAARRALRSGQTLRAADLMKPQIVSRDDGVTIIFKTKSITLTLRGKAMGNGAEGEMISVLNPTSKRIVQATITAPGVVTVNAVIQSFV